MLTPLLTMWRLSLASRIKCTFGPLDDWTTPPHQDFHPFLLWRKEQEFCQHCHCLCKCLMLNVLSCLFKLYCEINEPHIILNLNSTIQLMNVEWEKYILMRTEQPSATIWCYEQSPTKFNKPTKYQRRHTWPRTCSSPGLGTWGQELDCMAQQIEHFVNPK